jgi:arabinogalactan oligomer/maltooligosaccharide transport system permease protein
MARQVQLWLSRVILWAACAAVLLPLLWVVSASLTAGDAFFSGALFPRLLTFDNYRAVFAETDYLRWLKNTVMLAMAVGVIQAFVTALSAFAFARMRFKGRRVGLIGLLLLQMFPTFLNLAALYILFSKLELIDSLLGMALILVTGNAFNIWVMKGFIDNIPRELDEAAKVDGASPFQVFIKVILPLSLPMLAVQFLWAAVGVFNEYALSSVLLQSKEKLIMGPGLKQFIVNQFSAHWTQFAAAAVLTSLPLVVLWLMLQRYIVSGLSGAVKG